MRTGPNTSGSDEVEVGVERFGRGNRMSEHQPQKNGRPLPPVENRWKKGTSGNPRGRPKKQDCLTHLLREEIQKICPADREKRTWKELIVRATLQLAMKGNATAL